jgi:hypothetical protein
VGWRYDERARTTVLTMSGKGKVDWDTNGKGGHSLTLWGAGFYPPDTLRRPAEQDQSVPWALDFPKFKCWATSVRLPAAAARKYWDYERNRSAARSAA